MDESQTSSENPKPPLISERPWSFLGSGQPHTGIEKLPPPPPWRRFDGEPLAKRDLGEAARGENYYVTDPRLLDIVNAALLLRRPLFLTGKPGTGKSMLAYAVAYELMLGRVLHWPINTKTTLQDGLYRYDAVGRLQAASLSRPRAEAAAATYEPPPIGDFIRLGPLGTALLPAEQPRVLLIDEIDKSEIDLPNDLLHVLEEGEFEIPELSRAGKETFYVKPDANEGDERIPIVNGKVRCRAFPFIVMTSNGEREFPAPFFRRCLRYDLQPPGRAQLAEIVRKHFGRDLTDQEKLDAFLVRVGPLIAAYDEQRKRDDLALDQLLNAAYLSLQDVRLLTETEVAQERQAGGHAMDEPSARLREILFRALNRQ